MVDVVGTAALLTVAVRGGVSLTINTTYLSPMRGGRDCLIDARVVRVGRHIATIHVELSDNASGKVVAQGTHVKFISDTEPDLSKLAEAAKLGRPPPPVPAPTDAAIAAAAALPRSKL